MPNFLPTAPRPPRESGLPAPVVQRSQPHVRPLRRAPRRASRDLAPPGLPAPAAAPAREPHARRGMLDVCLAAWATAGARVPPWSQPEGPPLGDVGPGSPGRSARCRLPGRVGIALEQQQPVPPQPPLPQPPRSPPCLPPPPRAAPGRRRPTPRRSPGTSSAGSPRGSRPPRAPATPSRSRTGPPARRCPPPRLAPPAPPWPHSSPPPPLLLALERNRALCSGRRRWLERNASSCGRCRERRGPAGGWGASPARNSFEGEFDFLLREWRLHQADVPEVGSFFCKGGRA